MGIVHSPCTKKPFFVKKINDLVMIESYAQVNRMGSGEALTDLCNECLQKIKNAGAELLKTRKSYWGSERCLLLRLDVHIMACLVHRQRPVDQA